MARVYSDRNIKFESCHNCEERYIGCHAECEKYIKAKQEHDEVKLKIEESRMRERQVDRVVSESKHRMKTVRGNGVTSCRKR